MPFGSVRLVPGVNVERTPTLLEAGYVSALFGRFRDGLFEKIGGWIKFYNFAVGGIPRALHPWQDFNNVQRLAVGSTTVLGAIAVSGSFKVFTDITPQSLTTNPAVNLSTTNGSATVSVTDTAIATVTTFDAVFFNVPIAIGGIVLSGGYAVTLVLSATSYNITAASPATSTVPNAGAVPSFTTTNGSATVSVTIAAHGLVVGNTVNFPIATSVGGVSILGTYTVTTVTSSSVFTITASNQASSGATLSMNAGNAQYVYSITSGPSATGSGYSTGTYSTGVYSTGIVSAAQTGTPITASDWTLDNWGSFIVACPLNGGVYSWDPNGGYGNGLLISSGPFFNTGMFVAMPAQILVCFGSTNSAAISGGPVIGVTQDPLLIRWSDQANFNQWTVTATTQAGSYRVPTGSRIVGALQASQMGLIWTDIDLHSMSYAGAGGLVFNFNKIAGGCGLRGIHARCQLGSNVYWASQASFFQLSPNGVSPLPCPIWDAIFQDLDPANASKMALSANEPFNEVWVAYASLSGGTGENDKLVKYHTVDGTWDGPSPLPRSAMTGQSVLGFPIGSSPNGIVYSHESGYDSDGAPISWSFQTGYFQIADGEEFSFVDRIYPDFKWGTYAGSQNAQISITVLTTDFPGDTPNVFGPFLFTKSTEWVQLRARARQMAFIVSGTDIGSFVRLGRVRYRYAPAGRR